MILYISGSYPDNPEGIASGAKVLLDAMIKESDAQSFILLTTDTEVITKTIEENADCKYILMPNWRVNKGNIKRVTDILDKYDITAIHMEYPGDLYGKTFLASFLPFIVKKYNEKHNKKISFNVRLHEFSRARFLRKLAILPILRYASRVYVPAKKDREIVSKFAKGEVIRTTIGTNIKVISNEVLTSDKVTLAYFGSVYPGKGIEHMLSVWKKIKESDCADIFRFKIIGDIGTEDRNHFRDYHKQVWKWIEEYGLKDSIYVTGYISDAEVSKEIQESQIATVFYEDGLTLRRGSFLAFLAHGIPIVTSKGDEESSELFESCKGVIMTDREEEIIAAIQKYAALSPEDRESILKEDIELSKFFEWGNIAQTFLKDYGAMG